MALLAPGVVSLNSGSPLEQLYQSTDFRLSWDNDIAFHVSEHAVNLRKFRHKSQADVAEAMGTSQSAVALIEAGEHNITMAKLKRLAAALDGRIRFALEPKEMPCPAWPTWWQMHEAGLTGDWHLRGARVASDGMYWYLLGAWSAVVQPSVKPENVLSGQAS